MRTTVDLEEAILRRAEQQAQREGKSLGALIEEALRTMVPSASINSPPDSPDGLEADDPFFAALEEIRARGRSRADNRELQLE